MSNRVPTEAITDERLDRWAQRLRQEHATPLVLVGVGHDEQSGKIVVLVPDEPVVTGGVIAGCLRFAYRQLTGQEMPER